MNVLDKRFLMKQITIVELGDRLEGVTGTHGTYTKENI